MSMQTLSSAFLLAVACTIPRITHASGVSNAYPFWGSVLPGSQFLDVEDDTMGNIL